MMSPAREHGIAETPHLVEQTFEETLAATRGLVMSTSGPRGVAGAGPSRRCSRRWPKALEGRVVLLKVNVDESPALAARYGIRLIPTPLVFKAGTLVDRVVGAAPKTVLQGIVNARAS
jgi:thioredoxin 1